MLSHILTTLLLPALLFAAPTALSVRQSTCAPTSYSISDFTFDPKRVHFDLKSTFSDSSIVTDPANQGATCDGAAGTDGVFPNEFACSTGRSNLIINLRSDAPSNKYQVSHFWKCNGKNWMSSTPVEIDAASGGLVFQPQNVHEIPCSAPTCP